MQEAIYSAVFGALSSEHRMNIISNNLANVSTTGYKTDSVTFKDVFVPFAHDYILDSKEHLRAKPLWPDADVIAKPRLAEHKTDFAQGSLRKTGDPLDLAIQGDGFFKILTPDGVRYTRNGHFNAMPNGQIVDSNGNPLLGTDGPIFLSGSGVVEIDPAGNVSEGGAQVGTIALVRFDNPRGVIKDGQNLYKLSEDFEANEMAVSPGMPEITTGSDGTPQTRISPVIQQGFLESSNVEIVTEMVRMIEVNRVFEAYQKIMRGTQDMDSSLIKSMGKSV
ncbi:flagellar basal-body rod protein FlgF [Desulfocurvibacter africanus]|uniref:Flagellar basal-body rod protein FlgF n=1 Tax=Desulfocurvibacter africanus subsp. africanus str. Walvis Bay TaxID=690850 RepID=F3YZY8_DESAF|nr:flagellar basal-body rod protein FlgF [Desulfocurvibacter africanus]EGJ52017.1 flagellar basal-body rod protein FlgF [Desulfocurvibacter africanus subsp. africanus str. Walvis Bay]